ncbi:MULTISPECIES: hypothetical protein [Prochlorococcus]|uniref:hypothetical protein n=1 Tax=Prochlorococcus TaxID=1218 RepID=UPI00053393BB|nr:MULTISPECIES: hypothetical protein [Prochlorococcus]KGG11615.1 hypothetical protein EV05_1982 [Prochlorococcus sp. MIT 0601]
MSIQQGSFELAIFGVIFFALQLWWIKMIVKNGQEQEVVAGTTKDSLAEQKKRLEALLRK